MERLTCRHFWLVRRSQTSRVQAAVARCNRLPLCVAATRRLRREPPPKCSWPRSIQRASPLAEAAHVPRTVHHGRHIERHASPTGNRGHVINPLKRRMSEHDRDTRLAPVRPTGQRYAQDGAPARSIGESFAHPPRPAK